MSIVRLKHVDRFTDRHGRARYYFRRGKGKGMPLPGRPGTEEFMLARRRWLAMAWRGQSCSGALPVPLTGWCRIILPAPIICALAIARAMCTAW